jgi:tether containing UBX domain for GLUT4
MLSCKSSSVAADCVLFPALQADTLFKPRAMRDAEKAALASSLAPIPVRLHLPDATIIQASFTASQPLSAVQQLVTQIALESVAPALYVYTTPPKAVLKDMTATLYQLGLVPAAHLYVGCEPKKLKAPAAVAAISGKGQSMRRH